jgi:DNA helicase HerA-like ATPase
MIDGVRAFSLDGREFIFEAPLTAVFPLGGFVEIDTPSGRHLGQIVSEHAAPFDPVAPRVSGAGIIVATIDRKGGVSSPIATPFGEAAVVKARPETVESHLSSGKPGRTTMDIGVSQIDAGVPARLHAAGFARHTFVCGQSGSGKTYTMGVVLERLLAETDLRIVVLDPNSDHIHLGQARPIADVGIPEDAQGGMRARLSEVAPRVQVFGGEGLPLKVRFGHLAVEQQAMVLGLDPLADAEEYDAARRIVTGIGSRDYGLREIRELAAESDEPGAGRLRLRIDNLRVLDLDIWAEAGDDFVAGLLAEDWRAVVFDLGSLASARERSIITAGVLTALWRNRRERQPMLLVVDEAHNVCPQRPSDPTEAMGTDTMIAIAGEGRKFGLYLMLTTQRPQKVHENVLSQCGNLLLMKMVSMVDIKALVDAFSFVPSALIEMSAGFRLGEGIVAGPIANSPLLYKTGERYTPEGGGDVPATWARSRR